MNDFDLKDRIKKFGENIRVKPLKLHGNFARRKSKKLIPIMGLVISLFLVVTALAIDSDFLSGWKEYSSLTIEDYEEILKNGYGRTYDLVEESNGVKITLESAIADDLNTLILFKIENENDEKKYAIDHIRSYENFTVRGDILKTKTEEITKLLDRDVLGERELELIMSSSIRTVQRLYLKEEGASKVLVELVPMQDKKGRIDFNIKGLLQVFPLVKRNDKILSGDWNFEIEVEKEESKVYEINSVEDLDGNDFYIDRLTLTPTGTRLDYRYNTYNKEEKRRIENIDFKMTRFFKEYEISNIFAGALMNKEKRANNITSDYIVFKQMYDKTPRWLNLNFKKIGYRTSRRQRYKMDWDNLPQELDFNGNTITIKSVKKVGDDYFIRVVEDKSKNRDYSRSNWDLDSERNFDWNIETHNYKGYYLDRRGKKYSREEVEMDEGNYMDYIEYLEEYDLIITQYRPEDEEELKIQEVDRLILSNQYFERFLNKKVRIKLK